MSNPAAFIAKFRTNTAYLATEGNGEAGEAKVT